MAVSVGVPVIRVVPNEVVEVPIRIVRGPDLTGLVSISVQGLPPGISASEPTIPTNLSYGILRLERLAAAEDAGPLSVTITASSRDAALEVSVVHPLFVAGAPGAQDRSFGEDGEVRLGVVGLGHPVGSIDAASLDGAGRLVLLGTAQTKATSQGFLSRLVPSGRFDAGFGEQGTLLLRGDPTSVQDVVAFKEGGILFSGTVHEQGMDRHFLRKFLPDGSVDTGYGMEGEVGLNRSVNLIRARSQGVLVAYGSSLLLALDHAGQSNRDFHGYFTGGTSLISLAIDSNDGAWVGHAARYGASPLLVRITPGIHVDLSIGEKGEGYVPFAFPYLDPRVLISDVDGGGIALAVGPVGASGDGETFLVRFDREGRARREFGSAGLRTVGRGRGLDMVVQADGKLLVLWNRWDGTGSQTLLSRHLTNGRLDVTFGAGGAVEVFGERLVLDPVAGRIFVVGDDPTQGGVVQRFWL